MKKHIKRLKEPARLLLLLGLVLPLLLPASLRAADGAGISMTVGTTSPSGAAGMTNLPDTSRKDTVIKTKAINKTYSIGADDKLRIENSFGSVSIKTWDKNEIAVNIDIEVKGENEDEANSVLDGIKVSDKQEGHLITFKTSIEEGNNMGKWGHGRGKKNKSFSINYTVNMPAGNPLSIENSFGNTTVPDMNGPVELVSRFGSLKAGKLSHADHILVEFGKASIDAISNGKVFFQFDKEVNIRNISGDVKIGAEFSQHVAFNVSADIGQLNLSESYSSVHLVVPQSLSAALDVHISFGKFRNESDLGTQEDSGDKDMVGPRFDREYSGKGGDGKGKINVNSSFGSITLANKWPEEKDWEQDSKDHHEKSINKNKIKDKQKDKDVSI